MLAWARQRVRELESEELCGFIFKSKSPSSGMARVKVYSDKGNLSSSAGVGLFARVFMEHFPLLPVEEDGRLHDVRLRENFIERVFALQRWRRVIAGGGTAAGIVDFHTRHKLSLMAHSPKHLSALGKLVADAGRVPLQELVPAYEEKLLDALTRKGTARKHANVLYHILGYFKAELDGEEKEEMVELIEKYRLGELPLIVPTTLLNHYVRKYEKEYLTQQYYLQPHPLELQLRNHV
jgi:uncharacterized protein YbgA (DUF1722 family)